MAIYKKNNYRPNRHKEKEIEVDHKETLYQESTTAEVFDTLDEKASKTEAWVQKNQKTILGVIVSVVVIGLGYMLYEQLVVEPREKEASNELSYPLQSFENALNTNGIKEKDSLFNLSLEGTNGRYGFLDIAEKYQGTKASNIAVYSAGMAYLNMSKYKEAIEYLDKFQSDDEILSALALGNIGDAFAQLKQNKEALDYYQKAFEKSKNGYTAPIYLNKAGLIAIELKEYKKALDYFTRIKNDYPKSDEARTTDIQISKINALKN